MFALRNSSTRLASTAGRRFASVSAHIKKPFVPKNLEHTFQENFMSDPSTYPLMLIMTTAMCFVTGMTVNAFANYKDLRISPSKKHETIQTWGKDEKYNSGAQRILPHLPKIMHGDDWKKVQSGKGL